MRSSYANPDFGFPETVEKDAMPVLKKALAERNGVDAMNAAMQVIVARNMISASSFKENVGLLDSISGLLPAPYPQLCALLEANLYKEFYVRDSWTFNNRTLPLDSYPEDVASWSGELFAKKVLELVDESFIETQLLKKFASMKYQGFLRMWRRRKSRSFMSMISWSIIVLKCLIHFPWAREMK